jgi:hypothetical protein
MPYVVDHPHARELQCISQILDANAIIYDLALQDLTENVHLMLDRQQ